MLYNSICICIYVYTYIYLNDMFHGKHNGFMEPWGVRGGK